MENLFFTTTNNSPKFNGRYFKGNFVEIIQKDSVNMEKDISHINILLTTNKKDFAKCLLDCFAFPRFLGFKSRKSSIKWNHCRMFVKLFCIIHTFLVLKVRNIFSIV